MPDGLARNVIVLLCDWRGKVVWESNPSGPTAKPGEQAWANLTPESQERAKSDFGKVASLRETRTFQVANVSGKHFRCWLWPLDSPEIAVCVLALEVPAALTELTDRELECLQLMAQGIDTQSIAEKLDVSLSTVHTHLKRAREKLNIPGIEGLIAFAARYCYPTSAPFKESGS